MTPHQMKLRPSVRAGKFRLVGVGCLATAVWVAPATAQVSASAPWRIDLEAQCFSVGSNNVQRPNDASGTRFSVNDFASSTGTTGWLAAYGQGDWFYAKDELRVVVAPFVQSGTAIASVPIRYDGGLFEAGVPLEVRYKFNTYRITYDVPIFDDARSAGWALRLGGTLAIRDAQVKLSQAGVVRDFTSVGAIPLLYFSASRNLGQDWRLLGEFDAFPAPGGGGLFDGSLKLSYALSPQVALLAGARYQFGGAKDDEFYNFLRQWSATAGVSFKF